MNQHRLPALPRRELRPRPIPRPPRPGNEGEGLDSKGDLGAGCGVVHRRYMYRSARGLPSAHRRPPCFPTLTEANDGPAELARTGLLETASNVGEPIKKCSSLLPSHWHLSAEILLDPAAIRRPWVLSFNMTTTWHGLIVKSTHYHLTRHPDASSVHRYEMSYSQSSCLHASNLKYPLKLAGRSPLVHRSTRRRMPPTRPPEDAHGGGSDKKAKPLISPPKNAKSLFTSQPFLGCRRLFVWYRQCMHRFAHPQTDPLRSERAPCRRTWGRTSSP